MAQSDSYRTQFQDEEQGSLHIRHDDTAPSQQSTPIFSLEQAVQAIDQMPENSGQRVSWYAQLSEDQKANYQKFGTADGPAMGEMGYQGDVVSDHVSPDFPMQPMQPTDMPPSIAMGPPSDGSGMQQREDSRMGMQVMDPATGQWNGQFIDEAGNTYAPFQTGSVTPGNGAPNEGSMYVDRFGNKYIPVETGDENNMAMSAQAYDQVAMPNDAYPLQGFGNDSAMQHMQQPYPVDPGVMGGWPGQQG